MVKETETIDKLEKLGFKKASEKIKRLAVKKRKMAIAYEHYRFVKQEKVDAFNQKLRKQGTSYEYSSLAFTPVEDYTEVPPDHVLANLECAIERQCFDSFEIAHIIKVKDPILFGRITGCPDRFYIDQWDDDVSIQDILKDHEG